MFKIPLWREIDNTAFCFLFSSENLTWKQNFHTDTFWNYLLLNMALLWAKYQAGDEAEARGTDEQLFSDNPPLMRCGETYSAWQ